MSDNVAADSKPRGGPRSLLRKLLSAASAQPLFVAQMLSSAAGAGAMVMAAAAMPSKEFVTFSLLTLLTAALVGAVRAALFQPALIEMRQNPETHIHFRVTTMASVTAAVVFAITAYVLGASGTVPLWALTLTSTFPVFAEWLRTRGMALDQRHCVVRADALRLAATLCGPLALVFTTDALVFFVFVNLTYLTSIGYLVLRLPAVPAHISPLRFWRPASSQLIDFGIGQAVSTVPLLVLGAGFGPSAYIGGVRLAQTLLGPLNLVFAACMMNLLADGATRKTHADPEALIRNSRSLAKRLTVLSTALVLTLLLFLVCTGFHLRGTNNTSLLIGVAIVGALAVTSGFAGIDAIVMRLLGSHLLPTVGRALLLASTAAGYVVGYLLGGPDLSLIVGLVVAATANPIVFTLPARVVYRHSGSLDRGASCAT